jgi:large subunit ribosomal protein L33
MAKKKDATEIVFLQCDTCKRQNYAKKKNKKQNPDRLELTKYCKFDRKHTTHKEMK